ncbi:3-hydroxybutyryl-CoA dehydrogenase [Massilia sp. TWR1-2-2]|uniref:3-hydroxybutyryl-CoA dehydrogenase n=1 Tax=Massilia sp. TWR1-2-2 TaxID=2804584 RepID=UPI003CFB6310
MSAPALQHIAAVGAGRMGRGIAIAFAYAGHQVALIDIKPRTPEATAKLESESLAEIASSLRMLADLGMFDAGQLPAIMARVRFVGLADAPAALAGAGVVFEGVPEVLDGKRDAFAFICEHVRADAIVASTTSTFLVTDLAAFVTHPERLLNAHWLNPAYIVPLVELSPHPGTSVGVVDAMKAMLERAGKVPVVCAAAPGFIVPRLQALIMNEAARMIEQGIATAEEIDKATRYGFGFRFASIGVVEFIDFGGNDILYYASRYLAQAIDPARFAPPAIVEQYMEEGRIGLKTGKGFYDYTGVDTDAYRRDVLGRSLGMLRHLDLLRAPGAALHPKQ